MSENILVADVVVTPDEVARAAGVPLDAVITAVQRGVLSPVPGTRFLAFETAVAATDELRRVAVALHRPSERGLFAASVTVPRAVGRTALISFTGHGVAALMVFWLSMGQVESAPMDTSVPERAHLVFLQIPGPGGGGGGGGRHQPRPASRLSRVGQPAPSPSTPPIRQEPAPAVLPPPPPPEIEHAIAAPVRETAADEREQAGTVLPTPNAPETRGSGGDEGVGSSRGTGDGAGVGSGLDDGLGGGAGGGPYRPGSGVEAPRLLHEVKAEYTEEARRRNVMGEVLLEVVILRDGTVGQVRVVRGLGLGLDERATSAVRQWRFAPARRKGVPVDVVVEVAVDFSLR